MSVPLLLPVLGIVLGLALLVYASDAFVIGAARIAAHLRLSSIVIGAVVIGFGTSLPELLVSGLAGLEGSIDIAIANIIGSNIANMMLVLGAAALVGPIIVSSPVLKREAPLAIVATIAFGLVVRNGVLLWEALVLAALMVVTLTIIVVSARREDRAMRAEVEEFLADGPPDTRKEGTRATLGLIGTLAGAQLLVWSAIELAEGAGVSQGFIGITVVAIGTSLPELATAIQSARRGETDLVVGNLLGSNIFNALVVGASAVAAGAGQIASAPLVGIGVVVMIATSVVATAFMLTGYRVTRSEGVVLVAGYLAVLPLLR
jgi:cation:H+ antiporter